MDVRIPLRIARRATLAAAIALPLPAPAADALTVQGSCRDGVAHGAWQLTSRDGKPRAIGAFSKGRRTGSFIFWNDAGVRIAHVPFEEDRLNGTLALWFPRAARGGEAQRRVEAVYAAGKLNGVKRVWYADGRLRGEYAYAGHELIDARAWDSRGQALPADAARKHALADGAAHDAEYAALDGMVQSYLPICRAAAIPPAQRG